MDLYHLKFYNAQKHPNTFIGLFCIIKCQRKRLLVYCTCFISSRFKEQLHIYPTCFFSSSLKQNLNAQDIRLIGRGVQRVSSHLSPPPPQAPKVSFVDSLRKQLFFLTLCLWGHFARNNVCDSATEIPYWWHKICLESGQKCWLIDGVVTLF